MLRQARILCKLRVLSEKQLAYARRIHRELIPILGDRDAVFYEDASQSVVRILFFCLQDVLFFDFRMPRLTAVDKVFFYYVEMSRGRAKILLVMYCAVSTPPTFLPKYCDHRPFGSVLKAATYLADSIMRSSSSLSSHLSRT